MALADEPGQRSADALGAYFMGDVPMGEALSRICGAALQCVPVASRAGISMTVDGRVGTYVFTHPDVQEVDRPQYDTGDGPCVEAFRTGHVIMVERTTDEGPYPAFRRVAAAHGLLSVISTPMSTGTQTVGALNLYSPMASAFGEPDAAQMRTFSTQAAFLLLNHQAYWDARSLSENLEQAMRSRAQIEQAKGIIMASTGCTPDEAFEELRAQSQHENVKLRDIAAEIVRRSQRRPSSPA